ncbi:MAG: copper transporter, partial [Propionibacteriaceae bacterium]
MINFRYHIVSLMAVFLALSVGIVLGVTLRGPVDEGLVTQAEQDRKQVQDLRTELDRRNALDEYRDAWAQRTGKELTAG